MTIDLRDIERQTEIIEIDSLGGSVRLRAIGGLELAKIQLGMMSSNGKPLTDVDVLSATIPLIAKTIVDRLAAHF